jgi:hypothetical protein
MGGLRLGPVAAVFAAAWLGAVPEERRVRKHTAQGRPPAWLHLPTLASLRELATHRPDSVTPKAA